MYPTKTYPNLYTIATVCIKFVYLLLLLLLLSLQDVYLSLFFFFFKGNVNLQLSFSCRINNYVLLKPKFPQTVDQCQFVSELYLNITKKGK